jgi:hypothetical protein
VKPCRRGPTISERQSESFVKDFKFEMRNLHQLSATVGRDLGLDCLASGTDQLDVLAAVHAEGVAPGHAPGEDEQAQAPEDSHAADFLSGDVASVFSAGGAGGPVTTIVVVAVLRRLMIMGALLSGCGRGVHWWGRGVHGLGSVHGLHGSSVHISI